MSFLTPLYLLGLSAIFLPILLHLIRRIPRGRVQFSSLMFLAPSPPRLTRRSRLDHWILLLLRAAALALLAFAFARPFFRQPSVSSDPPSGRRVAILVDTSASMRRGGMWQQATRHVERVLSELEPPDDVALFAFDDRVRSLTGWSDDPMADVMTKRAAIRSAFGQLSPGWGSTDLGTALVNVADAMQVGSERHAAAQSHEVVLISDLQSGAELDGLRAREWPADVSVALAPVSAIQPGNAALRLLADEEPTAQRRSLRVRVVNGADSNREQFAVSFSAAATLAAESKAVTVQVPPGQSRVIRVDRPLETAVDRIILQGDESPFDNTLYLPPSQGAEERVVYIGGDDSRDPQGLFYYLQLALGQPAGERVKVTAQLPGDALDHLQWDPPRLVVVGDAVPAAAAERLQAYIDAGGVLLVVPVTREAAAALSRFLGPTRLAEEQASGEIRYALLGDIDFSHPVFATLASPRYNDFTRIRFWRHLKFTIDDPERIKLLARFDNGDPALWEHASGAGRVFVMASGWQPRDSQLALSSKFVPLLGGILEEAAGPALTLTNRTVGEVVELPRRPAETQASVRGPDGKTHELTAGQDRFSATDLPGVYQVRYPDQEFRFVVNVAPRESDTTPLERDRFEQLGVRLGDQPKSSQLAAVQRQMLDRELEGRQRVWQWLIAAALVLLVAEGWWAGRQSRTPDQEPGG